METEKKLLTKMSVEHKSELQTVSEKIMTIKRFPKPAVRSEEVRKEGNDLFCRKDHDAETHREIFSHYCRSIALAPLESELLAQAYGNRSAFLLHIRKYEDCIKDIDRTLKFVKSDLLIIKLLCRKVECIKKLGLSDYQNVLDVAENYVRKTDRKDKAQVDKMINKAKACSISNEKISTNREAKVLPQMDETLNCVSIEYDEEYGRHLVSKKDYSPGDCIFSDTPYVTVLNQSKNYTNCNYCLKICWSGVACDYCSWAMFCSEDCKKKAWVTHHDVECSVIPYIKGALYTLFDSMQVALRILLVGIREAGSIAKLREKLKLVDQCTDIRHKGFYNNGQFTNGTIESVYSLKSSGLSEFNILDGIASGALTTLIAIVKHSQLIKNFKYEKIDDIMANEDLVFLGSLLIKFTAIKSNNSHSITQLTCLCQRSKSSESDNQCCSRGGCIAPLASLMNHSCNPNASLIFGEDRKVTIYALEPIKRNSQIFITYAGFYYNKLPQDRKKRLEKYNFTCKCRACMECWPPLSILPDSASPVPSVFETKLYNDCTNVFAALDAKKMDFNKKDITKLCKTIGQAKRLSEPNLLAGILKGALGEIYSRVYGWQPPIYAFGHCSKV